MQFSELEKIMHENGVLTLAEIARKLKTTPQAVSNWKARDQVPYHIVSKVSQVSNTVNLYQSPGQLKNINKGTISDFFVILAEQLKVILVIPIVLLFLAFTYEKVIKSPIYISQASLLLPGNSQNIQGNFNGLMGIASQFGVNVPSSSQLDLSSPSLLPQLLSSRVFAERLLEKSFFTKRFNKNLTLLAILTHGNETPPVGKDTLITQAISSLSNMLEFIPGSSTSTFIVRSFEPRFTKQLADSALNQLEELNRFYKISNITEQITFISSRIASVRKDLRISEKDLKEFNEKNRQISSPSLQLEFDRLSREVDIQKGIFLTLKQQLEIAKIEEIQKASIFQILDKPQVPLAPSNQNLKLILILALILGISLGVLVGLFRSYIYNNEDLEERKKIRRIKLFVRKKIKDIFVDEKVYGLFSVALLIFLPYYLNYESEEPKYFGKYSQNLMIFVTLYISSIFLSLIAFMILKIKKSKS
tara:strand:+ start:236 stop:1660 length:1425 start_codon:yes stop_codon:yes gene_type:complete